MAVALLALFIALGGPGYAANLIDGASLKDRSVPAKKLAKNTLTGTEVKESKLRKVPSAANADRLGGKGSAAFLGSHATAGGDLGGQYPNPTIRLAESWRGIAPGSNSEDLCADASVTATFCSSIGPGGYQPWSSFGAPFETVGFYRDQLGTVHLKGLAKTDVLFGGPDPVRTDIFRLPTGYRPHAWRVFPSVGKANGGVDVAIAWVEVTDDGLVRFVSDCDSTQSTCSATRGYVSLDGIAFRP